MSQGLSTPQLLKTPLDTKEVGQSDGLSAIELLQLVLMELKVLNFQINSMQSTKPYRDDVDSIRATYYKEILK